MQPVEAVDSSYVLALLLVVCGVILLMLAVTTLMLISERRRNASLEELLRVDNKKHTQEILSQNERFNEQLYSYRERASIEHVATLRLLTESFATAAFGKPEG